MNKWLRVLVLCLISIFGLWLAVRGVDLESIGPMVMNTKGHMLALAILSTIGTLLVRAFRWRIFLPEASNVSLADLFLSTSVGLAANNIFPARLGEIVRAYAIRARSGTSISTALATLVVERVFDLAAVLGALGIVLIQLAVPDWVHQSGWTLLLADAVILISLVFIAIDNSIELGGRCEQKT